MTPQTVTAWRKAISVGERTEGTHRLRSAWTAEKLPPEVQAAAVERASTPEANAKIAVAVTGRLVSKKQAAALARGRKKAMKPIAQKKAGQTRKERGYRPPAAGRPWEPWEEALLGQVPDADVVQQTGRSLTAVRCRRRVLGILLRGGNGR